MENNHRTIWSPIWTSSEPNNTSQPLLQIELRADSEWNSGFQTDDLLLIESVGISEDGVGSLDIGLATDTKSDGERNSQEESPLEAQRPL
jgi:hypothetical protein